MSRRVVDSEPTSSSPQRSRGERIGNLQITADLALLMNAT